MIGHGAACDLGVTRANGLIDLPVSAASRKSRSGGARGGCATPFIVERSDHLDQRGHDRTPTRRQSRGEIDVGTRNTWRSCSEGKSWRLIRQ
jgi:hypothetical protein